MKRFGYLVEKIAEYDNILLAFYKAKKGKQDKSEVLLFEESLEENVVAMSKKILVGEVDVGKYYRFIITDPKKRTICAAAFEERVLHHAIMNICHPIFERQLIFDTYATRPDKGVHKALTRARQFAARYPYVGKLDVRKYFDSISHKILSEKLERILKDPILLKIFKSIIQSYEVSSGKGIPIGNLTSQYFANFYLSSLDHYAKEDLHTPAYIRYMDDVLIFGETEQQVKTIVGHIVQYAEQRLKLQIKTPVLVSTQQGVSFCGYRLYDKKILLNSRSKKRFTKKYIEYEEKLEKNEWTQQVYQQHIIPLLSFTQHAYSKAYRRNIRSKVRKGRTASCAAAVGTTTPGTAASRIVTTTTPTTGTTTTASALSSFLSLR